MKSTLEKKKSVLSSKDSVMAAQRQLTGELGEGSTAGLEPRDQSLGMLQGKDKDLSSSVPSSVTHPVHTGPFQVRFLRSHLSNPFSVI